ncbi:ankyrin repeat domain-containing protein [Microbulbifer sp. VAAC004]|uniref:ankyrin repeat domain-containing protein n=1 Tax=unclassified Microbulbifer TaxID=2619833 RepID=UPI0040397907
MPHKKIMIFIFVTIITGCSEVNEKQIALEEIKARKLTYDIDGLKKSTRNLDEDGAFVFESAGFFDDISDKDYKELIIHAAKSNNFGLVTRLLKLNKNIQLQTNESSTLIDKALEKGFSRTVILLINNGGKIKPGALFRSIYKDNYDFVKLIIDKGPKFDSSEYKEALYVAARIGHLNAIKAIIESNKAPQKAIDNAILGGAITEEIEVVKYFVAQGVDINYLAKDKCTSLHYLAQDGTVQMIEFMIDSGAHVNAECRGRETPLKWAYYGKNTEVIKYLTENGAVKN